MEKRKVRIYKNSNTEDNINNNFLKKAELGMQVNNIQLEEAILDELTLTTDLDEIADILENKYGISYIDAINSIEKVVDYLVQEDVNDTKNEMLSEDPNMEATLMGKTKPYNINNEWMSDDNADMYDEEDEEEEQNDLTQEDQQALSLERKGGTINKKKFVNTVLKGLKKASTGIQQDESNESSPMDMPNDGRQVLINNFRRGIKDAGNLHYAKDIYEKTQQLQQEVKQLPFVSTPMPEAKNGYSVSGNNYMVPDNDFTHYTHGANDIFNQEMNQVQGVGFENLPEARRGREQRQSDRQQRNVNKDFQNMFGNIAAGYSGVPGMPNYLQVINPQIVNPQVTHQSNSPAQTPSGPLIDIEYKKGPWWSGKREWSAKGIPAEMLMNMAGNGRNVMPGFGYVPSGINYGTSSSYSNQRTFPGEVIRTKSKIINSLADPKLNNESSNLNNNNIEKSNNELFDLEKGKQADLLANEQIKSEQLNLIPQSTNTAQGASIDRFNLELISSPTKPGYYYGIDSTGILYQFLGDISQHQVGKEPIALITPGTSNYEAVINSIYKKQYGGATTGMMPDQYGDLDKFVYGGNDEVSPIVSYEDNYINSKNTDDPFMFREGGLYKFDGEEDSQVNYTVSNPPAATLPNQYQSAAFNRYNSNATSESNFAAFNEMKKRGLVTGNYNPTKTYDMSNSYNTNTNTQNQGTTIQGGYPTAPSIKQQLLDKFSPFKRNQQTGKFYDFMWASQQGAPTTLDGQPYQIPGQGQTTQDPKTTTQGQVPGKAGYYYDSKYTKKGPFWNRERTLELTGRYIDPNNPNASANNVQANQFNNGKGPIFDGPIDNNTQDIYSNTDDLSNKSQRQIRQGERRTAREVARGEEQFPETSDNTSRLGNLEYMQQARNNVMSIKNYSNPSKSINSITPASGVGTDGFVSEGEEMNPPVGFAYGGYIPEFQGLENSQVSGTGPFDPNTSGIAGGGIGPCTEEQVTNAQPGDPCYNANYGNNTPKDFKVKYDINKARTLDFGNIANLSTATQRGIQGLANINDTMYNENYLNSRTSSDNRQPIEYKDQRGGYDALGQRIMAKTQGAGAVGFNDIVGQNAFSKHGGQLKYKKGGVYDISQEEIGQILAAGGQIKFIK